MATVATDGLRDLAQGRPFWTSADPFFRIPDDVEAARTVAGCAVATKRGSDLTRNPLASGGLDLGWFHDQRLAQVVESAIDVGQSDEGERVEAVAAATGDPVAFVWQLVEGRAVMADTSGWHARRVAAAAVARRRIAALFEEMECHGADVRRMVAPDPAPTVRYLLADVAEAFGRILVHGDLIAAGDAIDGLLHVADALGIEPGAARDSIRAALSLGGQPEETGA